MFLSFGFCGFNIQITNEQSINNNKVNRGICFSVGVSVLVLQELSIIK